jgi:hypothetical protein
MINCLYAAIKQTVGVLGIGNAVEHASTTLTETSTSRPECLRIFPKVVWRGANGRKSCSTPTTPLT